MDEKIKLMHKVIDVAMRINGGAVEKSGAGNPTVFITYFGHVNGIDVTVHEDGWDKDKDNYEHYRRFEFDFSKDILRLKKELEEFRMYAFGLRFRRRKTCGMI